MLRRALLLRKYRVIYRAASSAAEHDVHLWPDIVYKANSAHPKHQLDIYTAAAPYPRPKQRVVLFCHGGSWARGDRRHPMAPDVLYSNVGRACAAAGFVGVVMSYRLAPKVQHPEQVRDVASAIAWTCKNIGKYGGKPDDLIVFGQSAGAHLAALCLADPVWLQEAGLDDTAINSIRGVIGMSGLTSAIADRIGLLLHSGTDDLRRLACNPVGRMIVAAAFGTSGPQWDAASPLQLLQQTVKLAAPQQQQQQQQCSSNLLLNIPLQLITAQRDFHLKTDADKMHTVVKQYRDEHAIEAPVQRLHYDNENHFSLILKFGQQSDPATTAVMEFVKQIK
eukprot:3764-Heterococcus_DN1.PRE.2